MTCQFLRKGAYLAGFSVLGYLRKKENNACGIPRGKYNERMNSHVTRKVSSAILKLSVPLVLAFMVTPSPIAAEVIDCAAFKIVQITSATSTIGVGPTCEAAFRNAIAALQGNLPAQLNLSCDNCTIEGDPPVIKACVSRVAFDPTNDLSCGDCFPGPNPGTVYINCSLVAGAFITFLCHDACSSQ